MSKCHIHWRHVTRCHIHNNLDMSNSVASNLHTKLSKIQKLLNSILMRCRKNWYSNPEVKFWLCLITMPWVIVCGSSGIKCQDLWILNFQISPREQVSKCAKTPYHYLAPSQSSPEYPRSGQTDAKWVLDNKILQFRIGIFAKLKIILITVL